MRTMRTMTTFPLRFAFLTAFCLATLSAASQTDFPANFLKMDRSGPLTIQVGCQDYMFEINQAPGVPLGYVEVETTDSFARDYSGLAGSNEFRGEQDLSASGRVSYSIISSGSNTSRIGILELKETPGGAFYLVVDRGKTSLCLIWYETGEEELRNHIRLIRTKDGQLAAMVTFNDKEGIFKSLLPGIKERICILVPLQDSDPAKSLKLFRDKEGNSFALLLLRDGSSRAKATGSGKANLGVTVLTPSDKAMADKIGMTLVVVK